MKKKALLCLTLISSCLCMASRAQTTVSLDPNLLGQPPVSSWPTFNGDYTGQRYSTLNQITAANVDQITQQWVYKITSVGAQRGAAEPVIKCTPLLVGGVLYITIPDHLWALDAHTGKEIWHYDWVDHGGHLVGQRGVGIWKSSVYFLTPDNWLIALDAANGKEDRRASCRERV